MARRCPLCGGPDHEDLTLCPAYMEDDGSGGLGGPIAFGMDPLAMFDPQTQIRMQQLASSTQQTELLTRMLALTEAQTEELRALKAEVTTLRSRALPSGRGARALPAPPARPAFCSFCGGPLKACTPTCRVHGNENE